MLKFYAHLRIGLNCKNLDKADRLKVKIEKAIHLSIYKTEFLAQENNSFELTGYCELDYLTKEDALFNWLCHLELLGYNWQIKAPSIYKDFFSFEGERWTNEMNFKIPGMSYVSFELTDRALDYYDSAPLSEGQKVLILDSELTIEQEINGLDGYIASISERTNENWVFGVYINKLEQIYILSDSELDVSMD